MVCMVWLQAQTPTTHNHCPLHSPKPAHVRHHLQVVLAPEPVQGRPSPPKPCQCRLTEARRVGALQLEVGPPDNTWRYYWSLIGLLFILESISSHMQAPDCHIKNTGKTTKDQVRSKGKTNHMKVEQHKHRDRDSGGKGWTWQNRHVPPRPTHPPDRWTSERKQGHLRRSTARWSCHGFKTTTETQQALPSVVIEVQID